MRTSSLLHSRRGFSLVELLIGMTIFAMMSVIVMTIYVSVTSTTRRINANRVLAESAREIIDRVGGDLTQYGMSGGAMDIKSISSPKVYNYTGEGSDSIILKNGYYMYASRVGEGIDTCQKSTEKYIHCGLYFVKDQDSKNAYNLVDSFVPADADKRATIESLKFYVSGTGSSHKVMMNFTLALTPRSGIQSAERNNMKLHVQTTLSERSWKQ